MTDQADLASSLCLECGLCCNGTIYDFVWLRSGDRNSLEGTTARIAEQGSDTKLLFPCAMLDGAACTIYRARPQACRGFHCTVLNQVAAGEIDQTEARRRISETKLAAKRASEHYRPGESPVEARKRWFEMRGQPLEPGQAQFSLLMTVLNRLLDRYFRWPDRKQVEFTSEGKSPPEPGTGSDLNPR